MIGETDMSLCLIKVMATSSCSKPSERVVTFTSKLNSYDVV
jgi:hypothetical protein